MKEASLGKLSGPVAANIDTVLQDTYIKIQAFHSRSFIGNHCHKYLKPKVYEDLTNSVVTKTSSLTKNQNIIIEAKTKQWHTSLKS